MNVLSLISANNNAQGRLYVHIISSRTTMTPKAGGQADDEPNQADHSNVLRRMTPNLTKEGATCKDNTMQQTISQFYLDKPRPS